MDWDTYNPLDICLWEFYVLDTLTINNVFNNQRTVSLNRLLQEGFKPVKFEALKDEIEKKIEIV